MLLKLSIDQKNVSQRGKFLDFYNKYPLTACFLTFYPTALHSQRALEGNGFRVFRGHAPAKKSLASSPNGHSKTS
jgi:hypothetical protein